MTQREKHQFALDSFVKRIKDDPHIVALLMYGSLAYGTVWEKSDIDVEVIVRDGTVTSARWYTLEEAGIEINITSFSELSKFKKGGLQALRDGFDHGLYGKGNIVFSKDASLMEMFEDARRIGDDDAPRAFAAKIDYLVNWMHKAEKWITVLDDPLYAQRFIQLAAIQAADMELIRHKENPTRESIQRARELNPDLMHEIFVIPSTTAMTADGVRRALKVLDDYLMEHFEWWGKHILRFLSDGEVRTVSHINKSCGSVPLAYMAEKGIITQTTEPSLLFKKSKLTLDEKAYFYDGERR